MQEPVAHMVRHMLRPVPAIPDVRIARGHLSTFEPRHLCNVVWAMSRLGLHSGALYDAAALPLLRHRTSIADKGLAELASAFAAPAVQAVASSHNAVLYMVTTEAARRVRAGSFVPDALAQVLWTIWSAQKRDDAAISSEARLALRAGSVRSGRANHGSSEVLDVPDAHHSNLLHRGDVQAEAEAVLHVNVTEALLHDSARVIVQALADLAHAVCYPSLGCLCRT